MQLQLGFWAFQSIKVDILPANSILHKIQKQHWYEWYWCDTSLFILFFFLGGGGDEDCVLVAVFPFWWEAHKTPHRNKVIQCVEKKKMGLVGGKHPTPDGCSGIRI